MTENTPAGGAVAFAVELPDGSISHFGWMDMRLWQSAQTWLVLGEGCHYVFAYTQPPATVPLDAVLALVAKWRELAIGEPRGAAKRSRTCAAELEALTRGEGK